MKFITTWTVPQVPSILRSPAFSRLAAHRREGVKMLGRWDGMNGQGVAISEPNDLKAMYRWLSQRADPLPLTVTPCLEDADAGEVMASLSKR